MENKNLIKATNNAIKHYNLNRAGEVMKMAKVLQTYIAKNGLSVDIVGKKYVLVEGWSFAGGLLGLFPRVVKVENTGDNKWLATAEIIDRKTDKVVSTGYALCSKEEAKKKTFDDYAILSMAQTRAIGKAYRNLIGWVMKAANYESTPAEEMKPIVGEIKNSSTAPVKSIVSSKEIMVASVKKIEDAKDEKTLLMYRDKIAVSQGYSDSQKGMLINAINSKLKEYAKKK